MKITFLLISVWTLGSLAQAATPLVGDPVDCVNPLSGANGDAQFSRGNTVVAIVAPFGMTTWAPQTNGEAGPFYQMKHQQFEGIRATHQPSIWDYVRQPWKTQHAVRWVMDELYNQDGMIGDEDTGEMSAWYVFNAAGFYPFCPGTPITASPLQSQSLP